MGWGMVRSRWVSPLQPTRGYGGASWAPPAGSGAEPRPKTDFGVFWRPQNAPFCIYMTKIWGGQFALASPYSKFWGDLSHLPHPRDLRPCVYTCITVSLYWQQASMHYWQSTLTACPEKIKMFFVISHIKLGWCWRNLVHHFLNIFDVKLCKRFSPHLNNVSTLPCETWNAHWTCASATIKLLPKETPEFIPLQL